MSTPKLKSTANFGKQKVEGKILSMDYLYPTKTGKGMYTLYSKCGMVGGIIALQCYFWLMG